MDKVTNPSTSADQGGRVEDEPHSTHHPTAQRVRALYHARQAVQRAWGAGALDGEQASRMLGDLERCERREWAQLHDGGSSGNPTDVRQAIDLSLANLLDFVARNPCPTVYVPRNRDIYPVRLHLQA